MAEPTMPAPAGTVLTHDQHSSLLETAVTKATASLTAEKSEFQSKISELEKAIQETYVPEIADLKNKIDVLEADKATAETAAETARKELDDYKSEIARQSRINELKTTRTERIKAANPNVGEAFFSGERVTRWAQMSDEDFEGLVKDMTESAAAKSAEDTASTAVDTGRETAAFTGGKTTDKTDRPTVAALLAATRGNTGKEG